MEQISCRERLTDATPEQLQSVFEQVIKERLQRKYNDIKGIYERVNKDWNQTCYEILFRMMDVGVNKEAYHRLAITVPYHHILREVTSLQSIEALLLGGSGLLFRYENHRLGDKQSAPI